MTHRNNGVNFEGDEKIKIQARQYQRSLDIRPIW